MEDEEDEWEDESDMTSILFDYFDGTDEVLRPALGGFPEFQNPPIPTAISQGRENLNRTYGPIIIRT